MIRIAMDAEESKSIDKVDLRLKSQPKNGVILSLHHTVRGNNGQYYRIRFTIACFSGNDDRMACAGVGGNVHIIDLAEMKFWKIEMGLSTALQFDPYNEDSLVVATAKEFEVVILDVETGAVTKTLAGHTAAVQHISFTKGKNASYMMTGSPAEALIWELKNYTKYFFLHTYPGAEIQQIQFTPIGDYLVACFQNDTIQIWKHDTMQPVKQIIPVELKHMKGFAFTRDGRAMVMAGLSTTLILFNLDTWKVLKTIDLSKYNISGGQQVAFLPQIFDGGANKILCLLSCDCVLYLIDLESLTVMFKIFPEASCIKKFIVCNSGKYFMCVTQMGEVDVYKSSLVLDMAKHSKDEHVNVSHSVSQKAHRSRSHSAKHRVPEKIVARAETIERKSRSCLDTSRLRRILAQYGEYPEKFRPVIWSALLTTPTNIEAYSALVDKGMHPAYATLEKQFAIHNKGLLKSLKRLLSCLAHWCPLFGVMKFLPHLVFPFVKVLRNDPLLLFESIATILINYCQLWFEYAPFPPISVLAMIENVLAEYDQRLLDHYCKLGVTSQIYAQKILENSFSEIFTTSEWLSLWDHILSNEPAFLLMSVVSYNIVQRNAIRKLTTLEEVDKFFQTQHPIDKRTFLKKTYVLMNNTPDDIHPKSFLKAFTPLEKGDCYQQYSGYPKTTLCLKLAKKPTNQKPNLDMKQSLKDLTTICQEKLIQDRRKSCMSHTDSNKLESIVRDVYARRRSRMRESKDTSPSMTFQSLG